MENECQHENLYCDGHNHFCQTCGEWLEYCYEEGTWPSDDDEE